MSTVPRAATKHIAAAAISGHLDTRTAATEVAGEVHDRLGAGFDVAFMFGSFHHRAAFAAAAEIVRNTIEPAILLGATAESVLGVDRELEGLAGLTVIGLRLPAAKLHPFSIIPGQTRVFPNDPNAMRELIGFDDDHRATIMLADPFSTPMAQLLPAIGSCAGPKRAVPVIGGMASGASQPGQNVLILNEQSFPAGAVGLSISGTMQVDCVVSQGCRPIGEPFVMTKLKNNVILELGGKRAFDALQEMAPTLGEDERTLLTRGLLAGLVINEYKDRFGRGDFLVRNVMGLDKNTGGIAIADVPRVGQTVQFHARDATTADEDLQLLLDAQQLKEPPFAAMLFTCNGRGTRLFAEKNHDVQAIRGRLGEVPLAGFFAGGEIGPIGDQSFLHGHTAALALFRSRRPVV